MNETQDPIPAAFRLQVGWCNQLKAPFTAALLNWLSADWQAGGALRERLPHWDGDPQADMLPLRIAGALHGLVLCGQAPDLAAVYPPQADAFDAAHAAAPLAAALRGHDAHWQRYLANAPQTNEVLRSAVLLPGYAVVAQRTGLPLAICEIGASAGLNLIWDHYRYQLGGVAWGDAASPVQLQTQWRGAPPPALPTRIEVAERAACDRAPINLDEPDAAWRLASYVWPEQTQRLQRLRAAAQMATQAPWRVEAADAAAWVTRQLAQLRPGRCTLLVHTIVWHYLPASVQQAIRDAVQAAAMRATPDAPFGWLRMEPPAWEAPPELQLDLWPMGASLRLARAHPHGAWVEWV